MMRAVSFNKQSRSVLLLVTRLSSQKIKVHLLMAESVQWHLKSRFNSGDVKLKKQP